MRHHIFDGDRSGQFPIALLIKDTAFQTNDLKKAYLPTLEDAGIPASDVIAFTLDYVNGKAPVKHIKEYLGNIIPVLETMGTKYLYCADAAFFKVLTGQRKAEPHLGYILPCALAGYEHMKVILGVNHRSLLYDPKNEGKLSMSLDTLKNSVLGTYAALGSSIISFEEYPNTEKEISDWLDKLHDYPCLAVDIETFSLRFNKAGLGTITFCWSENEGIAFACDYEPLAQRDDDGNFGRQVNNPRIKQLLRQFFESYKGTLVFHNSPFDTKIMINELWMKDTLDTEGLLDGLHCLYENLEDTKVVAYLATNSTAGNKLSLKDLAHEFAGNWAQEEINDIRKIPLPELLQYNLVDGLSTQFVLKKYYPMMKADNQEELYRDLMIPSQKLITQIELTGMPVDMKAVGEAKKELGALVAAADVKIAATQAVKKTELILTERAWKKDYLDRKGKAKYPDKIFPKDKATFPRSIFNPNSGAQLQMLLHEVLKLPIIERTKTGQAATDADTLEALKNHTHNPDIKEIIEIISERATANKVLTTFIKAFEENSVLKKDGWYYLHGSFNLGGTVSGRLSSSDPNMQNIPSGSTYGKLVKKCFRGAKGWLFTGADFNSLEDYISALTTKDPQKLKVYLDGFDGHCLRAYSYFKEDMPDIDDTVESINSIKKKYPELRQKSKGPTFALTYAGTFIALMKQFGFSEKEAKSIEAKYHELYKASDDWVKKKLDEATQTGYVEVAFGLRVRTPLLGRTLRGRNVSPYEAEKEGRTAGNALGQSYGLLNNRAAVAFMKKVWDSPYKYDILPTGLIHDAIYPLVRDDINVVEFVNRELITEMEWQELPEIQHDKVKIGAELDIFYPDWAHPITLPNGISKQQIREICRKSQAA